MDGDTTRPLRRRRSILPSGDVGAIPPPLDILVSLLVDLQLASVDMVLTTRIFDYCLQQEVMRLLTVDYSKSSVHENLLYNLTVFEVPFWYCDVHSITYPFVSNDPHCDEAMSLVNSTREYGEFSESEDSSEEPDGFMEC